MPDPGRTPDLDAVTRTDRFLDALAAVEPAACSDPAEETLAGLLGGWRDELRQPPATGLVGDDEQAEVAAALRRAAASRRRAHRGMTVIGSVAATVLALGGVGAVVGTAHPGGPLYGLRTSLLGERQSDHDERIVADANIELDAISQMITERRWDQAQERLTVLNDTVQTVNDTHRKQDLVDRVNGLSVKVQKRDPDAAPPPGGAPASVTVSPGP